MPMRSQRLGARMHDAWMLSIAPALPARLPWPLAYRCYRLIARDRSLFPDAASAALIAPDYVPIDDVDAFVHKVRTFQLLDHADLVRSRRQPVDWWPDDIEVEGAWPRTGPFVVVSFHYGTGLWLLRRLRHDGFHSKLVSARFEREALASRPVLVRYGERRLAEVERICGEPIAYRPGARAALLGALQRGMPIIGVMDMPPRLAPNGQRPVEFLGQRASLPDGVLTLAAEMRVPIVPCWVELDFASGRRRVVIAEARPAEPIDDALAEIARLLDRLLRKEPAGWTFWREWRAWIDDAAPLYAPRSPDAASLSR